MAERTVLINAGPWLAVPPPGYGGIENVIATLVPELRRRGHRIVLATVGESQLEVDKQISVFDRGQFDSLAQPYGRVAGTVHAHMECVRAELRHDPDIDLVHDHVEVVGPSVLAALDSGPPVLQTLHWDVSKCAAFYSGFDGCGRVFFNGVSDRQLEFAPPRLRSQTLGAIPLATQVEALPYQPRKSGYLAVVGRLTPEKGADIAARICRERGLELRLAGPVAAASSRAEVEARLADRRDEWHELRDARFYLDCVRPHENRNVQWLGALDRAETLRLLASARAAVFPLRWEEPGATAAIEALACGTPVIGLDRGALRNIVDHGVTGFLAEDEDELAGYIARAHELRPEDCRRTALDRFDASLMAERYVELYQRVIERSAGEDGLQDFALASSELGH